ncbi:hypothetical protein, partial [Bacillus cereus]|uniref:hypothetical protein n=1 Tax=Bacillus cereus TaxID=1396 RepID=UPI001C92DEA1
SVWINAMWGLAPTRLASTHTQKQGETPFLRLLRASILSLIPFLMVFIIRYTKSSKTGCMTII